MMTSVDCRNVQTADPAGHTFFFTGKQNQICLVMLLKGYGACFKRKEIK